ncbi:MAG: bifunctional helix-turn-helix domain-containing protein/methylated-DNA--[protein]-cysteine S-methyltransferase [Deltaproteobacteria bacterium]|nr:bifunctional helix-turn-helix domain-containing protein/methylated-DNA--[protein]-cysteine S-methyltransferase [Deltaproteobacteria bacterium]
MNKKEISQQCHDYMRIEKAIGYVEANYKSRPTLDQIAESMHLSKYHFDRLFKRWAGISPIQFLHFLTVEHAKQKLAESRNLLDASLETGLSGPGRLHDLFVTFEAMTPGEFKQKGAGLKMEYGFHSTPFGECFLVVTDRGISHLAFVDAEDPAMVLSRFQQNWPEATLAENQARTGSMVNRIFSLDQSHESRPFHLLLKGTNFQVSVWRALLTIPMGNVVSYQDIAAYIGRPKAFRAVGSAIAVNPVGYLIPCHRVIAKSGRIHQYRWGVVRKKAILGWEASKSSSFGSVG